MDTKTVVQRWDTSYVSGADLERKVHPKMDCRVKLLNRPDAVREIPYQHVNASSMREAAERLHGGPLREHGGNHQLRAIVRLQIAGKEHVKYFFENVPAAGG